jgi:chromosome segregation ATPase
MTTSVVQRATRKVLVAGATASVIGAGAFCVQAAADWRAASAPLDTAPVSATSIGSALETQHQRAGGLASQIDQVALQMADLRTALQAANGAMANQSGTASTVQGQLNAAQTKLTTIQKQLKAAQTRLVQLNAAAAKQAAINASAAHGTTTIVKKVVTTTGASGKKGGGSGDN